MKHKVIRARKQKQIIKVLGQKDPRGWDNSIEIWMEGDLLKISVDLPELRCYEFKELIRESGKIIVVQQKT